MWPLPPSPSSSAPPSFMWKPAPVEASACGSQRLWKPAPVEASALVHVEAARVEASTCGSQHLWKPALVEASTCGSQHLWKPAPSFMSKPLMWKPVGVHVEASTRGRASSHAVASSYEPKSCAGALAPPLLRCRGLRGRCARRASLGGAGRRPRGGERAIDVMRGTWWRWAPYWAIKKRSASSSTSPAAPPEPPQASSSSPEAHSC